MKRPRQVSVDDDVPFLGFHPHQQLITPHPGVADQDIHPPKGLDDLVKRCRCSRVDSDDKLVDLAGAPHLPEGCYHHLSSLTLACTRHHDMRARPPKSKGNRPANTALASRNYCDLPLEPRHGALIVLP